MNKREYKKAVEALGTGMCVEIFNIGVTTKGADAAKINDAINLVWNAMQGLRIKNTLLWTNGMPYRKTASNTTKPAMSITVISFPSSIQNLRLRLTRL